MTYSFLQHKISGAIEADDEYWRWLEEGEFRLPRCASCDHWTWPAHFRCGQCGSWEFAWTPVTLEGAIFSWTRSWYAFDRVMERKEDVPYVSLVVELPQAGGARVMGVLTGDDSRAAIGAKVRGTILPPSPKTKHYPSVTWAIVS
ncbi:Zn-ribbon domain-containing OB-fold protein [Sphingomonas chungangi]|uniref:Zn-ribbon domain-containing OB-fold protein n=1 Tax=Sphingomonas chungangi TaxID=2683589 RepID=UPI001C684F2A